MRAAALVVLIACTPPPIPQHERPPRAELGDTFTFRSRTLGEQRVINVYVPPGYAKSHDRYPVLYMPDGGMAEDFPHIAADVDVSIRNEVIRPLIVVGVENTDRKRDLVGGSAAFRAFLHDELAPEIDRRYRTTAERELIGESLAGLFVVETLLVAPDHYAGYIAADPSMWLDDETLVRDAARHLAGWTAGPKTLYVATADAPEMQADARMLLDAIAITGAPIHATYDPMPEEHHNTIFAIAGLRGIRAVFALQ
ncbi:MAG: alpha/beta hydrolase [Deltaproteobacteria bacterium]|nr:alpha/beta hydrolase [Deltaproteobacteria bacterium]